MARLFLIVNLHDDTVTGLLDLADTDQGKVFDLISNDEHLRHVAAYIVQRVADARDLQLHGQIRAFTLDPPAANMP